jgi:hypothetical protein
MTPPPSGIYFADRRVDFGVETSGSNSSGRAFDHRMVGREHFAFVHEVHLADDLGHE